MPTELRVVAATSTSITLSWRFNSSAEIDGFRVSYVHHSFEDVRTLTTREKTPQFELTDLGKKQYSVIFLLVLLSYHQTS